MNELLGWSGSMTNRQYLAWKSWLEEEWNVPNRNDHYLMSVALRILQKFNPDATTLPLDSMKLKFNFVESKVDKVETKEDAPKPNWTKGRTPPPIMTKETIQEVNLKIAKSRWGKLSAGKQNEPSQ